MHGVSLILTLLWQIAVILAASRLMGMLFARLRQPQVVGEMVAGIMLGPSVFGLLAPDAAAAVFPAESLRYLNLLSQLGVIFFLFLVGLELDPKLLRQRGDAAVVISHVSIICPFLLGAGLTLWLYPELFNDTSAMRFTAVALFMGAAMSITAFPVLARILTERNLHRTPVGAITITCAAVDDVTAWCMLAFVIGVSRAAGIGPAVLTAILAGVYVAFMLLVVRPLLGRLELHYQRRAGLSREMLALIFCLVLGSSLATEAIGVHPLFGAFLIGAMMPKGGGLARELSIKLEDFTVVLLLPIFFAYAGLKTRIDLLAGGGLWIHTALIIATACVGKFGGSTLAARACGMGWRESSAIGILMNTRGLMELVILNIGRELGVITDAVFAMMVLMALVTTGMTTPILHWIYPDRLFGVAPESTRTAVKGVFTALVAVARPERARGLLSLARKLAGWDGRLLALHLREAADHDAYLSAADGAEAVRDEVLERVIREVESPTETIDSAIEPISLVSQDPAGDIVDVARTKRPDLLLIGHHQPVLSQRMLGGIVHHVLDGAPGDVAVYIERGQALPRRVLVPYVGANPHTRLALELARRLAQNVEAEVTILHVIPASARGAPPMGAADETHRVFSDAGQPTPVTFRVIPDDSPVDAVLREAGEYDLVILGVSPEWGLESQMFGWRAERIVRDCPRSLLIVRRRLP